MMRWANAILVMAAAAHGEPHKIDAAKSVMTVHVYKAGVLSAFGHDHVISAPIASGTVDAEARKVELRSEAPALRVQDPKASEKDRQEIQSTMLGPEVLDAEKFKQIEFRSTSVEQAGTGAWKVVGNLTLHGKTQPVSMEVRETAGRYAGNCRFRMTEFGIKPVKVAGGTVRVKDEVQIDFEIQLAR